MTLAAIFAACALLVFPAGGSDRFTLSPALWQSEQPASSPPDAQQEPTTPPAPEAKPEPPAKPAQEAKPDQPPAENQAQPQAQPATSQPAPESAQPPSPPPAAKTATKKHRKKKPAPPSDGPTKVVVRDGGTAEPTAQISPGGVSKEQASHQLQSTTQLLSATNTNLQKLSSRPLNPGQLDTVKQIRTYMEQAKAATGSGDLQRAHNLASKAQMLSDDLLKQ